MWFCEVKVVNSELIRDFILEFHVVRGVEKRYFILILNEGIITQDVVKIIKDTLKLPLITVSWVVDFVNWVTNEKLTFCGMTFKGFCNSSYIAFDMRCNS